MNDPLYLNKRHDVHAPIKQNELEDKKSNFSYTRVSGYNIFSFFLSPAHNAPASRVNEQSKKNMYKETFS